MAQAARQLRTPSRQGLQAPWSPDARPVSAGGRAEGIWKASRECACRNAYGLHASLLSTLLLSRSITFTVTQGAAPVSGKMCAGVTYQVTVRAISILSSNMMQEQNCSVPPACAREVGGSGNGWQVSGRAGHIGECRCQLRGNAPRLTATRCAPCTPCPVPTGHCAAAPTGTTTCVSLMPAGRLG